MAISNFQEKLLFYTKQKSLISSKLSNIQMQQLSATKDTAAKQQAYNQQLLMSIQKCYLNFKMNTNLNYQV